MTGQVEQLFHPVKATRYGNPKHLFAKKLWNSHWVLGSSNLGAVDALLNTSASSFLPCVVDISVGICVGVGCL